ncbi:MAG: hypothetical protein ACFFD1_10575, partial [Candidatus Thorarchaeota archaeon]
DALDGFEGTVCFNITGHTLEYLLNNDQEIIESIKSLIKKHSIELLLTGYSHPILPLLPYSRIKTQLKSHLEILKKNFNITPIGAWPPELAVSPIVLENLKQLGIRWVVVDQEHFDLTKKFSNDQNLFERRKETITESLGTAFWSKGIVNTIINYRRTLKKVRNHMQDLTQPLQMSHVENLSLVLSSQSWWNATKIAISNGVSLFKTTHLLKEIIKSQAWYIPLYTSDIEFFGFREFGGKIPSPNSLIKFLKELNNIDIETISPSNIPQSEWNNNPTFIGSGSWSPDKSFRIWTDSEDNREYNRRLREIYSKLEKNYPNNEFNSEIERLLRITENSDTRGWAPLPERKLEAYRAIKELYNNIF